MRLLLSALLAICAVEGGIRLWPNEQNELSDDTRRKYDVNNDNDLAALYKRIAQQDKICDEINDQGYCVTSDGTPETHGYNQEACTSNWMSKYDAPGRCCSQDYNANREGDPNWVSKCGISLDNVTKFVHYLLDDDEVNPRKGATIRQLEAARISVSAWTAAIDRYMTHKHEQYASDDFSNDFPPNNNWSYENFENWIDSYVEAWGYSKREDFKDLHFEMEAGEGAPEGFDDAMLAALGISIPTELEQCEQELEELTSSGGSGECNCGYVGSGTNLNVQYLCQADSVCYNLVQGWCAEDESACVIPN